MDDLERKMQGELDGLAGASAAEIERGVQEILVATLKQAFSLREDETALLLLSLDGDMLRFAYPPELAKGGSNTFPVRFPSVAGRVAGGGGCVLSNCVQDEPHLAFYERVPVGGMAPSAIQKLLAVPLQGPETRILGVVEISRRGRATEEAGPDFSPADQERLERLAAIAATTLAGVIGAP